jgi:hypothetical protein
MPITMVTGAEWNHAHSAAGFTSDDGIIQINASIANTPDRIALVLYHELIHIQAGLHDLSVYQTNMAMRILTENEESIAHMGTLWFGLCHNQQLHGAIYAVLSGHLPSGSMEALAPNRYSRVCVASWLDSWDSCGRYLSMSFAPEKGNSI